MPERGEEEVAGTAAGPRCHFWVGRLSVAGSSRSDAMGGLVVFRVLLSSSVLIVVDVVVIVIIVVVGLIHVVVIWLEIHEDMPFLVSTYKHACEVGGCRCRTSQKAPTANARRCCSTTTSIGAWVYVCVYVCARV